MTEERTGPVRVERVTYAPDLEAIRRYFVGIIDSTTQNSGAGPLQVAAHACPCQATARLQQAAVPQLPA